MRPHLPSLVRGRGVVWVVTTVSTKISLDPHVVRNFPNKSGLLSSDAEKEGNQRSKKILLRGSLVVSSQYSRLPRDTMVTLRVED